MSLALRMDVTFLLDSSIDSCLPSLLFLLLPEWECSREPLYRFHFLVCTYFLHCTIQGCGFNTNVHSSGENCFHVLNYAVKTQLYGNCHSKLGVSWCRWEWAVNLVVLLFYKAMGYVPLSPCSIFTVTMISLTVQFKRLREVRMYNSIACENLKLDVFKISPLTHLR